VSRRAPSGPPAAEQGWVYTLHLDPPLGHARHYTGFGKNLDARLAAHEHGEGARLTQVQLDRGGTWRLASAEPGTRDREAQLKERGASRRCQICQDEAEVSEPEPERELEAGP
jgi:predicted GIY-YIG superfamily endonuclease